MWTWILVGPACSFPEPTTTAVDSGAADSGTRVVSPPICPYEQLVLQVCVETTAPTSATSTAPVAAVGRGTVTELGEGSSLAPVAGSDSLSPAWACAPGTTYQQVRLQDAAGQVWTFSWDLVGTGVDNASLWPIRVGAEIDFEVVLEPTSAELALVLSDAGGPLFLAEKVGFRRKPVLTDHERGGMTVERRAGERCVSTFGAGLTFYQASFGGSSEAVALWPGERLPVELTDLTLEVMLADCTFHDCIGDPCSFDAWAAWRL
jgi:hypothetical protein